MMWRKATPRGQEFRASGPKEDKGSHHPVCSTGYTCYWRMVFKEDPCIIPQLSGESYIQKETLFIWEARTENSPCLLWPTSFNKFIFIWVIKNRKLNLWWCFLWAIIHSFSKHSTFTWKSGHEARDCPGHTSNHRAETTFYMMASSCLRWQWTKSARFIEHRYLIIPFWPHRDCGGGRGSLEYHPWAEDSECLRKPLDIPLPVLLDG